MVPRRHRLLLLIVPLRRILHRCAIPCTTTIPAAAEGRAATPSIALLRPVPLLLAIAALPSISSATVPALLSIAARLPLAQQLAEEAAALLLAWREVRRPAAARVLLCLSSVLRAEAEVPVDTHRIGPCSCTSAARRCLPVVAVALASVGAQWSAARSRVFFPLQTRRERCVGFCGTPSGAAVGVIGLVQIGLLVVADHGVIRAGGVAWRGAGGGAVVGGRGVRRCGGLVPLRLLRVDVDVEPGAKSASEFIYLAQRAQEHASLPFLVLVVPDGLPALGDLGRRRAGGWCVACVEWSVSCQDRE